jgi:hypothetical protein
MLRSLLGVHRGLLTLRRLPAVSSPEGAITAMEVMLLVSCGAVAAAATSLLDFNLRLPGHAILRAVFPMALGLALVPRQTAGTVMGASSLATVLILGMVRGHGAGAGAITSLALTGPLLDVALWGADRGWRLYLGFVAAGLGSNIAALLVQALFKSAEATGVGGRRAAIEWWASAPISYPVCGILAGALSAAVWFQLRARRTARKEESTA